MHITHQTPADTPVRVRPAAIGSRHQNHAHGTLVGTKGKFAIVRISVGHGGRPVRVKLSDCSVWKARQQG